MEGDYYITVGYSRVKDKANGTHGWVIFGTGCKSVPRKIEAVVTMLNLMGFEAPAEIDPWRRHSGGYSVGEQGSSPESLLCSSSTRRDKN